MTEYTNVYDIFLSKITDYGLVSLTQNELEDNLKKHLKSAIVKFKHCVKDLNNRDDELGVFNVELTDEEIEVLAYLMIIEWSNNYILNIELLKQNFSTRDFNLFSSANLLKELTNLRKTYKDEIVNLITFYYYTN